MTRARRIGSAVGTAFCMAVAGVACAATVPAGRPAAEAVHDASVPPIRSPVWFNSKPLRPQDLRGKVVLVEFWTFGCVNCLRTFPAMRKLHAKYSSKDFLIVGVHTPEFEREKDATRVQEAIERLKLPYAVALDNDYQVWRAFQNRYWPSLYLVDRHGKIRYWHVGELHVGSRDWSALVGRIDQLRSE